MREEVERKASPEGKIASGSFHSRRFRLIQAKSLSTFGRGGWGASVTLRFASDLKQHKFVRASPEGGLAII